MLTADERAQIRVEADPAQQAERWRSLALRLLDELEAAEAKRGDGDILQELNDLCRMCSKSHNAIDRINNGQFAGLTLDVKCQQLADAYRSEKDRADRLQNEVETLRAARESLEPVGWAYSSGSPTSCEGTWWYVTTHICPSGERRRVYLAPPEPLEESC